MLRRQSRRKREREVLLVKRRRSAEDWQATAAASPRTRNSNSAPPLLSLLSPLLLLLLLLCSCSPLTSSPQHDGAGSAAPFPSSSLPSLPSLLLLLLKGLLQGRLWGHRSPGHPCQLLRSACLSAAKFKIRQASSSRLRRRLPCCSTCLSRSLSPCLRRRSRRRRSCSAPCVSV